jgi:anti-sigma28 factor (negative regulator of flagellin synthesis)
MTDTISGESQRTASVMAKQAVNANNKQRNDSSDVAAPSSVKSEIAAVSFDSVKVEQIKQSIELGNYPLDNKKIAESFIPLEKLL